MCADSRDSSFKHTVETCVCVCAGRSIYIAVGADGKRRAQEVADSHFRVELYIFFFASSSSSFFQFLLIPCVCGIREKKKQQQLYTTVIFPEQLLFVSNNFFAVVVVVVCVCVQLLSSFLLFLELKIHRPASCDQNCDRVCL